MNEDATRTIAENNTYKAMEGYIEMGKYSKEQSDQLFSAGNYNSDYIRRIYGRQWVNKIMRGGHGDDEDEPMEYHGTAGNHDFYIPDCMGACRGSGTCTFHIFAKAVSPGSDLFYEVKRR